MIRIIELRHDTGQFQNPSSVPRSPSPGAVKLSDLGQEVSSLPGTREGVADTLDRKDRAERRMRGQSCSSSSQSTW